MLTLRFGTGREEPQTLTAIGKRLGFSAERASQLMLDTGNEQQLPATRAVEARLACLRSDIGAASDPRRCARAR